MWGGRVGLVEGFDYVRTVEVVVWFPRVFAYVETLPFDKVFNAVISESAV